MEPSNRKTIAQEIEQVAPVLANLRQHYDNPIPDGYDVLLADQVMGPVRLALWQATNTNENLYTGQRNPEYHGDAQADPNGIIEKILPNLLQTIECGPSRQHESIAHPSPKNQPFPHKIIHHWIFLAAACLLIIFATIAIRFLLLEPKTTNTSQNLTVDESMAFLEANAAEMEVEELIEWGILEQEDLDIQTEETRITTKDSL